MKIQSEVVGRQVIKSEMLKEGFDSAAKDINTIYSC